jgi:hypothetical protein
VAPLTAPSTGIGAGEGRPPGDVTVYQLRAVVAGISPIIWRRLLVPDGCTIDGLHEVFQSAFGWDDEHLHRFWIHGRLYDGQSCRDRTTRLTDLGLRVGERFGYEYDFLAWWRLSLRAEAIGPGEPGPLPRCTGGRRAGPPQEWRGCWDFGERTHPYRLYEAKLRAAEILLALAEGDSEQPAGSLSWRDELADLLALLGLERFDRRALNRALAQAGAQPVIEEGTR